MTKVLLLGLGNPGRQYEKSRHNAGFCFIDSIIENFDCEKIRENKRSILWQLQQDHATFYLAKPLTYMNLSGMCLADLRRRTGIMLDQICVICDNMDLPLGRIRLKFGGGSAGQKGLKSIIEMGGGSQFWRLYIGIGRPVPPQDVASYVLSRFPKEEEQVFLNLCSQKGQELIQQFFTQGFANLQTTFNL
ncbi:MAG: aminoacyl-tRNA hydrolase [Spirochaetia bacterium]